jgi:purine-binding chemotaxis protein CheW
MAEQASVVRTGETQTKDLMKGGKYLTFQLGKEIYGLEILKVQEIIGMMSVTRIPKTPEFIRGVINLRGKVISIIELRRKFGMETKADTEKTCVVVVQVGENSHQITMGAVVDEVSEVLEIGTNQLEPPPKFGGNAKIDFILGIGKVGQKVVMLLDIDKVLTNRDMDLVDQAPQRT